MFFPTVLILTCIFAFFNLYGRILHILGITTYEFSDNEKAILEGGKIFGKIDRDQLNFHDNFDNLEIEIAISHDTKII